MNSTRKQRVPVFLELFRVHIMLVLFVKLSSILIANRITGNSDLAFC
jgi:hypothetical protein